MSNEYKTFKIFMTAMDCEQDSLLKDLQEDVPEVNLSFFEYNFQENALMCEGTNHNWIFLKSGVGPINASMNLSAILNKYEVSSVFLFGVGGALSDKIEQGDYFIASTIADQDSLYYGENIEKMGTGRPYLSLSEEEKKKNNKDYRVQPMITELFKMFCEKNYLEYKKGKVLSGASFVDSLQRRKYLNKTFNADFVEMESAACAYVCSKFHVRFGMMKICSDDLSGSEDQYVDFIKENMNNVYSLFKFLDETDI